MESRLVPSHFVIVCYRERVYRERVISRNNGVCDMKVLFITTLGTGYKGGANISSSLLAALLRENGVEVKTLFIRSEKPQTRLDRFLSFLSEGFYQLRNPVLDMLVRA